MHVNYKANEGIFNFKVSVSHSTMYHFNCIILTVPLQLVI